MTTIYIVADERFGDTYVFTPEELEDEMDSCQEIFGDEFKHDEFIKAIEEYDLADPNDLDEFEQNHQQYVMKNECWTEAAESIILAFVK